MRKIIIYFISLLFLLSCNKIAQDKYYPSFIKAGQISGAGIKYFDFIPDDTLKIIGYPDTLEITRDLDLDNDKVIDFEITLRISSPYMLGATSSSLLIKPLGLNSICVSKSNVNWVDSLRYNDTIYQNCNWSDSIALIYSHTRYINNDQCTYGFWYKNTTNYYVGVRILKGENQLFGWIDLKNSVIKQYALTYKD